jgi:hypothetical protein
MAMGDQTPPTVDDAFRGFLGTLSPERRAELRAVLSASRERAPAHGDGTADRETARHAADLALLAELRAAGRDLPASRAGSEAAGHMVRLSDVAPERLRWLSPGRLAAGKITVLDGDPGLGKSTLLCELAARVTRGEALPGGAAGRPRGVLLLSAEDDLRDTIRPRLDAAGGDPHRVVALMTAPDGTAAGRPVAVPDDVGLLEAIARRIDAALVIIDPLVAYLASGLSANSDQDVRRALAALKQFGERTGAAIVVVRHLNKSTGSNPLYRGGGSIGIIGAARCGLLLAPDPEEPARRILAVTKGNLGTPPPSLVFRLAEQPGSDVARIVWEGETRWTAAQLLRAAEEEGDEPGHLSHLEDARSWLRQALAEGPRPVKEIEAEAEARGISRATLKQARKSEEVVAWKERVPKGRWMLYATEQGGDSGKGDQLVGSENVSPLNRLRPLHREGGSIPAGVEDDAGSVDTASVSPVTACCVDCGTTLAFGSGRRCRPCLAKALTEDR